MWQKGLDAVVARITSATVKIGNKTYTGEFDQTKISVSPLALNTIAVGAGASSNPYTISFPISSLPMSGTPVTVELSLTCGGGSFSFPLRFYRIRLRGHA